MSRPRLPFPRLVLLLAGLGLAAPPLLSAAAESSPPHTWQWETECSDPADTGLHRQRGTVDVAPYRGDSPLYRRGFPKVSDNRRHLACTIAFPRSRGGNSSRRTI